MDSRKQPARTCQPHAPGAVRGRLLVIGAIGLLMTGAGAFAQAPPGFAVTPDTLTRFAGRLHPVLVHFPVALIIGALVIELGAVLRRRWREDIDDAPAVSRGGLACLAIGVLGAAAAVGTGWANDAADPQGASVADIVFTHRWVGVGSAILSAITLGIGLAAQEGWLVVVFRMCLVSVAGLVGFGGHLGGTLVYGPGYVWSAFEAASPPVGRADARPDDAPVLTGLDAEVAALFRSRCVQCHGPRRHKGGLRLDRLGEVVRAGVVVKPGDAEGSEIVRRTTLPLDDPDFMPGEGDPLTDAEVDLIRRWIRGLSGGGAGAPAAGGGNPDGAEGPVDDGGAAGAPARSVPSDEARVAVQARLEALRNLGAAPSFLAAESDLVDVNLSVLGARCTDETLASLAGLEACVARLNLAGTAVTDAGLAVLARFGALERLSLSGTRVSDAGVGAIGGLSRLESLNLVGTGVTDGALPVIAGMPALRRVYLWRSGVTEAGAAAIRASHPDLEVQLGAGFAPESPAGAAGPPRRPACCLAAESAGKACDHACCVEAAAKGEVCAKCLGG